MPRTLTASTSREGSSSGSGGDHAPTHLRNTDPALRRAFHPVARSIEVGREPRSVRLLGESWALARSAATGRPMARRRPDGVAPAALAERDGLVFLAPADPLPHTELLPVDEAHDAGFRVGWLAPIRARVGAGLMTDNFLDMAHFPFVHAATIGADDSAVVRGAVVTREGLGMTVCAEHPFAHHEDPGVAAGIRPLVQRRRLTYVYRAPFSVCLRIEYLDAGGTNTIAFYVQPEDDDTCRLYAAVYRDDLADDEAMAAAVRYEEQIVQEDLDLQVQYRDKRLPLDLRTEVHIQADKPTVELRRILADLVGETERSPV